MLVLIWMCLLLTVGGNNAATGRNERAANTEKYSVTFKNITAEAGLCVVLNCSFTTDDFDVTDVFWFKCNEQKCDTSPPIFNSSAKDNVQELFKGRVSLLEPDVKKKNCSIIINDLKESDSGVYLLRIRGDTSTKKNDGYSFPDRATINVTGLSQKPTVTVPALTAGQQTTLTCTAPGLCSGSAPTFTWTWRGAGRKDSHITGNITETENVTDVLQRHSSTLTLNVSVEHHSTELSCEVHFTGNVTAEETVTLNVTRASEILNKSGCEVKSKVLTCVCMSEGFPLPSIKWPLLENHTEYSVNTSVSNYTVNSTIILTVNDHSNLTVVCVSSNGNNEAKKTLNNTIKKDDVLSDSPEDPLTAVLITLKQPQVIIAFLSGIVISAIICCLATRCHRRKQKRSEIQAETLELATTQAVPLIDDGQAVLANVGTDDHEAAGQSAPDGDVVPKDVEYSTLDFSRLKSSTSEAAEARETQGTTETEYAEIKKEGTEERRDDGGEEVGMLEGNKKEEEEEEAVAGEDRETEQCEPAEEGGEDVALYSNIKEIMGET